MTIQLYTMGADETNILTMHQESNPFKVGDKIHLKVKEITNDRLDRFHRIVRDRFVDNNSEAHDRFNGKTATLRHEHMYVNFDVLSDGELTVEYHCDISDE